MKVFFLFLLFFNEPGQFLESNLSEFLNWGIFGALQMHQNALKCLLGLSFDDSFSHSILTTMTFSFIHISVTAKF